MLANTREPHKKPLLQRATVLLWLGCGLIVLTPWLGLQFGATDLSWQQVLAGLLGEGSSHVERVVMDLRLPRTLIGLVIGIHFALSGWLLQLLTRNPLAEAGILGISGGASLMAVAAFVVGDWIQTGDNPYGGIPFALQYLPLLAMLGGLLAALAVYGLSLRRGGLSPVKYGTTWAHLEALLPWTALGMIGVLILLRPLSAMQLEDEQARSLGLHLNRWRAIALVVAALMAASAVGIVGPVGFIGLLVPHISRRLAGSGLLAQCLMCTALGATLAVAADTLGRTIFAPYELPVGVVSAALGVPFFLYLLSRQP